MSAADTQTNQDLHAEAREALVTLARCLDRMVISPIGSETRTLYGLMSPALEGVGEAIYPARVGNEDEAAVKTLS